VPQTSEFVQVQFQPIFFGMWRGVGILKTNVSEESVAFIIRVQEYAGDMFLRNIGF
jgi:hypothetical protein